VTGQGWTSLGGRAYHRRMIEAFTTAFIIYFVVIDPIGNAPIFLAVTQHQDRARKLRTALEGTAIATAIMLFFALCGAWILGYLKISEAAFRIAGGIILFLVALDMLAARRQQRKREATTGDEQAPEPDNVAIYPLAIPLLAGPSAIMSVIVVTGGFASGGFGAVLTGYAALLAVMVATGAILSLTVLAEGWMNERITMVFSRITAIILAGLSVQYIIDGLAAIGLVTLR
ncbi:MAG: MarC family protein, partial [Rhodobiaceae bacterium]